MEGKRQETTTAGFGSGSSPSRVGAANPTWASGTTNNNNNNSMDILFGPRDSGYGSGSGSFGSIFPPPSAVLARNSRAQDSGNPAGSRNNGTLASQGCGKADDGSGKTKGGGMYLQNETVEPCYLSSSIYYGGQENYYPRTSRTSESHQMFKKEDGDGESSSINSDSACRGNWWQGSLYY